MELNKNVNIVEQYIDCYQWRELKMEQMTNFKLEIEPSETLHTKFGTAKIDKTTGYYYITSRKEKNNGKKLHRLIFEDVHGNIANDFHIHHSDGNRLNNCILNLEPMKREDHQRLHNVGRKNKEETLLKMSEAQNTIGYFRVSKIKSEKYKQGFIYSYQYYEDGQQLRIQSISLTKLEEKVKEKGLKWTVLKE